MNAVSLPRLDALAAAPSASLAAIRAGLIAAGLTADNIGAVTRPFAHFPEVFRRPLRQHRLASLEAPLTAALQAFVFGEPADRKLLEMALGATFSDVMELGLLVERDGALVGSHEVGTTETQLVCPFRLSIYDDFHFFVDDLSLGKDAVMGHGPTTVALGQASIPRQHVNRALDVGTGAGTLAILLSQHADEVVGTDVSNRAITLARINAALNERTNVEFRQGDLFAPVAGEQFDLVVSQPPFVAHGTGPQADEVGRTQTQLLFRDGGSRGDEIALRLLAGVKSVLKPSDQGGRAVIFAEWPEFTHLPSGIPSDPLEDRIQKAVRGEREGGNDFDLLILTCPPNPPDDASVYYAAQAHGDLGPAFVASAIEHRKHFDELSICGLTPTFVVVRRTENPLGWTRRVPIRPLADVNIRSTRVDRLLIAEDLLRDPDALRLATLRVPLKTRFIHEHEEVHPNAEQQLSAHLPKTALVGPIGLNQEMLTLLSIVNQAANVQAALDLFQEVTGLPAAESEARLLPAIRESLELGSLQVRLPTDTRA